MSRLGLVLVLCLALGGCEKEYYRDKGQITGYDMGMCMCCGGVFITIDNTVFRFDQLPEDTDPDFLNEPFPIDVKLTWKIKEGACDWPTSIISIEKIKKL